MMRKMGYSLQRGNGLNFGKGRRDFLRNFVPKGKPANYYDNTRRGLGYVTPPPPTTIKSSDNKPIPSRSATSSEWESMSVWGRCSRSSPLIWLQVANWSQPKLLMRNHGLSIWIFSGKSDSNNANHLLKTKWSRLTWVVKITLNPYV